MGYPARGLGVLIAVVALFVGARWVAGPAYLGLFDPDRTQNVAEWAGKPLLYMDIENCDICHSERVETWQVAAHKGLSCESCHGQASQHVESGVSLAIEESSELCTRCHARLDSRPASHPQVDVEEHAGSIECTACHNPHDPGQGAPPNVPHSLEGRSGWCTVCHEPTGVWPFPDNHVGRTSDMCLTCHVSHEPVPPAVPDSMWESSNCTACHGEIGIVPFPEDHAGYTTDTCVTCHQPQGSEPVTPADGETHGPDGPPDVPSSMENSSDCMVCHGAGGITPFPENHAGRTGETCLTCHESQASVPPDPTPTASSGETAGPVGPPNVPHTLEGRSECTLCHGEGGLKPFPADHAGRTGDICLACHKQQ